MTQRKGASQNLTNAGEKTARASSFSNRLPDSDTLNTAIENIFTEKGISFQRFSIVDRKPNKHASTSPSEIIRCDLDGGRSFHLLLKYAPSSVGAKHVDGSHGHRGGLSYEADVYRHVLPFSGMPMTRFYGAYSFSTHGPLVLVLEYLQGSLRVSHLPDGIFRAAHWIAQFHANCATRLSRQAGRWLRRYDRAYYRGWAQRTAIAAKPFRKEFPWLPELCSRFDDFIEDLLNSPPTIIHGEFVTQNIRVRDESVYPIDWESAALAAGEIDLVALTDGWTPDIVEACYQKYERTRWPAGASGDFERRVEAARMYWHMRWLSEDGWMSGMIRKAPWRFEDMRAAGERRGLL